MLKNIIKIRKIYNLSINLCKTYLEKNNNNYNKTLEYIKKINHNLSRNFNNYVIINFFNNKNLYVLKIKFNSIILKNSSIINKIILELENIKNIKKEILNFFTLYSIKLNEFLFIERILLFKHKNIIFYNHNKNYFCIIKYKTSIEKIICYHIISKKIKFLKLKQCSLCLFFQKQFDNNNLISNLLNKNNILYIYYITENFVNFFYE